MDNSGTSSSEMVASPVASASVAPDGLLRVTRKRSAGSWKSSSTVGTEILPTVCPAWNVSVPVRSS